MSVSLHTLCPKCNTHRLHVNKYGKQFCAYCPAPSKTQGDAGQSAYRHSVAGALVRADYDRLMTIKGGMNISTSQLMTLIVLAYLDKADLAAKYPYSGCPSSAQQAERALRAAAEGAGHTAYGGANGDGHE